MACLFAQICCPSGIANKAAEQIGLRELYSGFFSFSRDICRFIKDNLLKVDRIDRMKTIQPFKLS